MNDLRALAAKLNPVCHHALEIAVKQTARHRHFMVEIEHFLLALLDARHSDLALTCAVQGLAANRFRDQLTQAIEGFERGNDRAPALARPLADLLFASWMVASQEMGLPAIRSGAILKALLDTDAIGVSRFGSVPVFALIRDGLHRDLPAVMRGGMEDGLGPHSAPVAPSRSADAPAPGVLPQIPGLDPQTDKVFRRDAQPIWTDSANGSLRRAISPTLCGPLQLIEVTLPAGASLATPAVVGKFLYQQIWLVFGTLHLTVGAEQHVLTQGDCLVLGPPTERIFSNRGTEDCRYLLAQGRRGAQSPRQLSSPKAEVDCND